MRQNRQSDVALLVAAFRERLMPALESVRGQGYHPVVFETLRSRERAQSLSKKGTGIVDSMHLYGVAADVICGVHQWDCARHHCYFYAALGDAVEDAGLTWGGRWKRKDLPHVQLPPVSAQDLIRKCPPDELDTLCRDILGGKVR